MKRLPLAKWLEIAGTVRSGLYGREAFRPNVERVAALAALEQQEHGCGLEAQIEMMKRAFDCMRTSVNPRWDGSIA